MINLEKRQIKKRASFTFPVLTAQKFIGLFQGSNQPDEEQTALLATAHYTLATFQDLSVSQSKMHINAAITLLTKIEPHKRKDNWGVQIAHAYFKRAELFEEKQAFPQAIHDYSQMIHALEKSPTLVLDDEDRLLLAQAAISIADIIVNDQVSDKHLFLHPLSYINKALEHLTKITQYDDDVLVTEAYAHQIAGIALSAQHFEEAKEAFRVALATAFKVDSFRTLPLLADIYTCLGLLYEQQYQRCPIQKVPEVLLDHAVVYFTLSLLFSPSELDEKEEGSVLESIFEMVYRVLDPYLSPLPFQVSTDVIDALIYLYLYSLDNLLPNQELSQQLKEPEALDSYAQHLYWLVVEAYRKKYPRTQFYEIFYPSKMDMALEVSEVLTKIQNNRKNNIYYLKTQVLF